MQLIPYSYLRSDLWARYSLDRAEELAVDEEKASFLRPWTRMHYGIAAVKGMSQAAAYALPTLIFLAGHILASSVNYFVENHGCRFISRQFSTVSSRFTGSLSATLVATTGAFLSPQAVLFMHRYAVQNMSKNWDAFKKQIHSDCARHIEKARQLRFAQTAEEERYHVGKAIDRTTASGAKQLTDLFFDLLAENRLKHIEGDIEYADKQFALDYLSNSEKLQAVEESMQRLAEYARRQKKKIGRLPMTFVEVAVYEVRQAEKKQRKVLQCVRKTESRVGEKYRAVASFNEKKFKKKMSGYTQKITDDLTAHRDRLQKEQKDLQLYWDANVVASKKEIEKRKWQLWWSSEEEERQKIETEMQGLQTQRSACMQQAAILCKKVMQAATSFDKRCNRYVQHSSWWRLWRSGIDQQVERFASASLA